ncbi:MAG: hypothetical protein GC157_11780 [Frankiales bacterium]|nr:hypothetical protein [Frankiales bacterium]
MANQMLAEVEKALKDGPARTSMTTTTETVQLPDVIVATAACLGIAIVAAVPGWLFLSGSIVLYLGLIVVLMAAGFYVARRSPVSPGLALGYSALLGLMMGAFTHMATTGYNDNVALITQAVLGTVAGAVAMLLVYSTPFGKRASRAGKLFIGVMIGYFLLGIANIVAALFGVGGGWGFYGVSGIGLVLCAVGVALACWSLLVDIGAAANAIAAGAPRSWSWSLGMALASSIVWLYLELLRLLAILNR